MFVHIKNRAGDPDYNNLEEGKKPRTNSIMWSVVDQRHV